MNDNTNNDKLNPTFSNPETREAFNNKVKEVLTGTQNRIEYLKKQLENINNTDSTGK